MEKGIRDFKAALDQRALTQGQTDFALAVELTAHELNPQPRRCLNDRCACAVFHDDAQRRRWTLHQRQSIFRLLLHQFGVMSGKMPNGRQPTPATTWRVTVESWLRC